jgi:23S rRNA pseudouridine1911/1915/1917 synthase
MMAHKLPFHILFEDPHVLVLSKPAGLLSQADASGDVSVVSVLQEYLGRDYVGLIHRLDRNTSGLMCIAKRSKSADRLTQSLKSGELRREYLAWVWNLGRRALTPTTLLNLHRKLGTKAVLGPHPDAVEATLHYEPYNPLNLPDAPLGLPVSCLRIRLDTGRFHQIRVQMAAAGLPLLGDKKYGVESQPSGVPNEILRADRLIPRHALHSATLSFPHPVRGVSGSHQKMEASVLTFEELSVPDLEEALRRIRA